RARRRADGQPRRDGGGVDPRAALGAPRALRADVRDGHARPARGVGGAARDPARQGARALRHRGGVPRTRPRVGAPLLGEGRPVSVLRFGPYVFKTVWRARTRSLLTVVGTA